MPSLSTMSRITASQFLPPIPVLFRLPVPSFLCASAHILASIFTTSAGFVLLFMRMDFFIVLFSSRYLSSVCSFLRLLFCIRSMLCICFAFYRHIQVTYELQKRYKGRRRAFYFSRYARALLLLCPLSGSFLPLCVYILPYRKSTVNTFFAIFSIFLLQKYYIFINKWGGCRHNCDILLKQLQQASRAVSCN